MGMISKKKKARQLFYLSEAMKKGNVICLQKKWKAWN